MKFAIVGRGILGSSLYFMLTKAGHEVKVIESRKRRVFPSLIHSLLLKGKDVQLAMESLKFYREFNVPMREFPSLTIGKVSMDVITQWQEVGVQIREEYVGWISSDAIVALGGDRLVYVSKLIYAVPYIEGSAEIDLSKGVVSVGGKQVKADKIIVTAGPWNPCLVGVKSKSYYCWATLIYSKIRELGSHFVYDYEKGFYSRPVIGLATGMAIVGDGKAVESPPGNRVSLDKEEVMAKVRDRVGHFVPLYTAGEFCEGTPDMKPSYGKIGENVYYAGGLDGYGAEVGPGLAKLLLDLIMKGEVEREYYAERFSEVGDFTIGREPHEI
ncbi:FAD-binding oxidoreductase [Metallosphaera tengchongensis]|uniref:FAD-binding oxidoreductase n=1 Tax=Metallosphaera tengchongensis TaxID=1532350 RepID=A0A6N0NWT8_9CREN|nr:FAD-binding oxidoreductase [Metallosphaera tengchongensis]QKR00333.1 FAD-binding oxidoreductase [Metallosphaera tengchongensis]